MSDLTAEMGEMLLELEFCGGGNECDEGGTHGDYCPICQTGEIDDRAGPHKADCRWVALMRKAGLR